MKWRSTTYQVALSPTCYTSAVLLMSLKIGCKKWKLLATFTNRLLRLRFFTQFCMKTTHVYGTQISYEKLHHTYECVSVAMNCFAVCKIHADVEESFLTSLTFFWLLLLLFFFSHLLSFLFIVRSSLNSFPPGQELNRSRNEHRIISESAYLQEIFCVPFVS